MKAGDVVLAVNGERMVFARQLTEAISRNAGKQIELLIRRGGAELHIPVTPEQRGDRGCIGVSISEETRTFKPGPLEAVRLSVEQNIESSGLIFRTLGGLFTGATSVRQLQGPVGIAQLSGESAQAGWVALLSLMAVDQPQPGAAEPDAGAGARRRSHPDHGARRRGAPRLQHAGEGEDAAGRASSC